MAKTNYQTYTSETPIDVFRKDFLRRASMCGALVKKHPALEPIAAECRENIASIDGRKSGLLSAEDELVVAKALEDVEKMDVIDVYSALRLTMTIHEGDATPDFLPEAPSSLKKLGTKNFTDRVTSGLESLGLLPEDHPVRISYEAQLKKEIDEFKTADLAEDSVRSKLSKIKLGLSMYKNELSQVREAQLGAIQNVLRDRSKPPLFTIPWRSSSSKSGGGTETETSETATPTEETPE
jgi:hypothetical protein